GFREVQELTDNGKLFTSHLIFSGVLSIAYAGSKAAQIILETQMFRRKRMSKTIDSLTDHYIICGYGRMGRQIVEGLMEINKPFVVIENDQEKIDALIDRKILFINGDATNDDTLIKARIDKAKGFVAVVRTDAENVFATLSAKELNPNLYIVARAIDDSTESKLKRAGANRVVKPYELGGNRMLQLLIRPGVIDFIESVAKSKDVEINLEEITVSGNSSLIGSTLMDSPIRRELNIIIVAIIRKDGKFIYNPKSTTTFENGDKLIAIGELKNLNQMNKICDIKES
ncbi:MAG: TrkA family potassium uptake protein, partial [Melioribacteraceae bacterium]|nr:TrkA family potassium uptake protein [Melioribacteraceae bacterium]